MNDVSAASKVWGSDDAVAEPAQANGSANPTDVSDFQQWLGEDAKASSAHVAPGDHAMPSTVRGVLEAMTHSMHEDEARLQKTMRRAVRSGDPIEGLNVQKELSDLYLNHALTTKVISKTTQAIESLTKMQ